MAIKAQTEVQLTSMNDMKTMSFDEADGLTIASDDGSTKVVISDDSVAIYQGDVKVAEFNAEALKLGMNATAANGAYIDLLNGLGKISAYKPYSMTNLQIESDAIDLRAEQQQNDHNLLSTIDIRTEIIDETDWQNEVTLHNADAGTGQNETMIELVTNSYGASYIDLIAKNVWINGSSPFQWKPICLNPGGGNAKTHTVGDDTLRACGEFLIACQMAHNDTTRVIASTVIPASDFLGVTTDNSDGAHQAYYNSTYHTGVSYLGNGKVKMYETSSAYAVLYGR